LAGNDRRWKVDDPFRNCERVIDSLAYCRRKAVAGTDHCDESLDALRCIELALLKAYGVMSVPVATAQ
jgi:hypothetical protein